MRLIDADMAQRIADKELFADEAGAVQWVLSHTLTIDPVKHGRWEYIRQRFVDGGYRDEYGCSECGYEKSVPIGAFLPNYCPNCGAKMDLEANE